MWEGKAAGVKCWGWGALSVMRWSRNLAGSVGGCFLFLCIDVFVEGWNGLYKEYRPWFLLFMNGRIWVGVGYAKHIGYCFSQLIVSQIDFKRRKAQCG